MGIALLFYFNMGLSAAVIEDTTLSKMADKPDLKHDVEPSGHELDIGLMLAVESTPEDEQRVLRKLDLQ